MSYPIILALFMLPIGLLAGCVIATRVQRAAARATTPAQPPKVDADASELISLKTRLHETMQQAETAKNARTTFLTNMSHEIRTPMNGVIGFTELLLSSDLDSAQRQQVQLIADSGRAMLRLLNDVLDVAKIEAGQMRLFNETTDIRQDLEHCISMLEPVARSRSLGLKLHVEDCVPEEVTLDRLRFREILLNLIGNALKFSEEGQVEVDIRIARTRAGEMLQITIIDSGIGIPKDRQQAIFAPFAHADDSNARHRSGTGLGLTISSQIAKLMGGSIAVESMPGLGSTFTVHLPLNQCQRTEDQPSTEPAIGRTSAALQGRRVLVAEDHDINQQLILAMLDSLGIEAQLAENGRDAIDAVIRADREGRPFEIVLMDVHMPDTDGLEATRQLRHAGFGYDKLPIIALTANCYADDIAQCLDAGMQGHIGKPVTLAELTNKLLEQIVEDKAAQTKATATSESLQNAEQSSGTFSALERKYNRRKKALFKRIGLVLDSAAEDGDWSGLNRELHRLAGVAANFGDTRLGELSRQIEDELKSQHSPVARQQLLAREYTKLKDAA